jgi:hypothetical protein
VIKSSRRALTLPDQRLEVSRSSALNRTTYRFTEISFAAMIPSAAKSGGKSES